MIFFAANQFNFGGNMVSYVLYDGDLYRIFIGNENTGTAQLVSKYLSTSMGAAILKKGEQDRQRDQQLLVHDSYLHTQLNKNDCWKILEVEDIVSKKDCYRIRCLIEKGRSRKKCRLEPNQMFKCKNCNTEIYLQNEGVHAETPIVLCPCCHTVVEVSSCYGFGPVWPACIYCGDRLVAELKKTGPYRDNIFELWILGEKVPFPLSDELRKENYKRHFEICDLVIELLRERNIC